MADEQGALRLVGYRNPRTGHLHKNKLDMGVGSDWEPLYQVVGYTRANERDVPLGGPRETFWWKREATDLRAALRHLRIKRNAMFRHAAERIEILAHALAHVETCDNTSCPDCLHLSRDALQRAPDGSFLMKEDLEDALEALEKMVSQYLSGSPADGYQHDFMSAGEAACEALARLRPDEWVETPTGMAPAEPRDTDPHIQRMFSRFDDSEPFAPDWVIAPGEILADWAREHGLAAHLAATRIGMGLNDYLALICGERVIQQDLADTLEAATGIKAQIWLRLEASFRMGLAIGRTWSLVSQVEKETEKASE
jgi:plasmid maintenance system antidote protein VapI